MEGQFLFKLNPMIIPVTIDYGKSWRQMLKEADFGGIDPMITEANFPIGKGTGVVQARVAILTLALDEKQFVYTHGVEKARSILKFLPIGMEHVFGVGAQNRNLCIGRVVNIDTICILEGQRRAVHLVSSLKEFMLGLSFCDQPFGRHCSFFGLCPD